MARNYYEFFHSRINSGGNYVSFIRDDPQVVTDDANTYISNFGGTVDWLGKRGYFLVNKSNVIGLLRNWVAHYPEALGSTWIFFQDGGQATKSPRKTWSHNE